MQIPRGHELVATIFMLTGMAIVWGSIPVVLVLKAGGLI
jgi:hypothetical protein